MNAIIYYDTYDSPLGEIILASNGDALTGLWFNDKKVSCVGDQEDKVVCTDIQENASKKDLSIFHETKKWLDIYFNGKNPGPIPDISFDSPGATPFRLSVWKLLLKIPYGKTTTYGDLASKIAGQRKIPRMSAQAIGGAVGSNPISIIVPCHRVIGTSGELVGYAGGLDRKKYLLELEGVKL